MSRNRFLLIISNKDRRQESTKWSANIRLNIIPKKYIFGRLLSTQGVLGKGMRSTNGLKHGHRIGKNCNFYIAVLKPLKQFSTVRKGEAMYINHPPWFKFVSQYSQLMLQLGKGTARMYYLKLKLLQWLAINVRKWLIKIGADFHLQGVEYAFERIYISFY